ncbi:hypothetical protein N9224_00725 [Akkermansiaceae bacterium]|nr:hypothetical protein [Akkermansiaceae bacterium]
MKYKIATLAALSLFICPLASAEDKHDHDDEKHEEHAHEIQAPNGGRILHDIHPHAEFFITKDRKVQITFVDDEGNAVASDQTIKAIGGERAKPTKFTFEKTKTGFLSKEKLPEGKLVPIVLTFTHDQEKKRIKFNVNMADCPTCEFLEYACTCEHDHDDHEGHDHE